MLTNFGTDLNLADLHFPKSFDFTKLDQTGFNYLENILADSAKIKLVIIDTLGSAVSGTDKNLGMSYLSDYKLWGAIQKYALKKRGCFLFLHHTRKMKAESVFDEISGTRGLTGAADVNIVLETKSKTSYLHLQGRDVEDKKIQLQLDKNSFTWHFQGEATDTYISPERMEIINLLSDKPGYELKVGEISDKLGKDRTTISQLLRSMRISGEVVPGSGFGFYKLPVN